jgi:hypothetical protein
MHHPVAIIFWLIVMAFLVAVMLTKRPHKTWMKTAMTAFFGYFFLWSVYCMSHTSTGVAIFFVSAMIAILVWRTIKGWPEWWAEL